MNLGGEVALIIRQLSDAANRNPAVSTDGRESSLITEVVDSLRLTLAALIQSHSSGPLEGAGLRLVAQHRGGIELRQAGLPLPISERHLKGILEQSGLALWPGQVLLLDHGLAKRIVEGALKAVSEEELEVRGRKIRILAASIGLEDPDPPDNFPKERHASSAA